MMFNFGCHFLCFVPCFDNILFMCQLIASVMKYFLFHFYLLTLVHLVQILYWNCHCNSSQKELFTYYIIQTLPQNQRPPICMLCNKFSCHPSAPEH